MKYFGGLKTSDKISAMFSLFNLFSLFILLFSINVIYFYIWYSGIQAQSMYDMNRNYNLYSSGVNKTNREAFVDYILQKDTIFTSENTGQEICSRGVAQKIHNNKDTLEEIKKSFFYEIGDKTYFIFSQTYKGIGEVKILYDTTAYFNSQMIIIKVSLFIIFIFLILNYIFGKIISRFVLKDLKIIAKHAEDMDLNKKNTCIRVDGPKDDEIRILSDTLNNAFWKISSQNQNQKQFITDVSHEFKTPLMIINSKIDVYNKALEKGKADTNDLSGLLWGIKNHTKKLNNLLETLFFLSRVEDGIINNEKDRIVLKSFLKKLADDIITSSDKKIDIQLDIDPETSLEIDVTSFNILVENLLTNAVKFGKKEVKINIIFKDNTLEIHDNGEWIAPEKLEKIWEKFSRFDTRIEGFGIGLFLVKRIASVYDWKIDVSSEVKKGTCFTIHF